MTTDQMRAEFETWAKANEKNIELSFVMRDGQFFYQYQAEVAFLIYCAGRKAEREAIQLRNWDGIRLGGTGKPEGE